MRAHGTLALVCLQTGEGFNAEVLGVTPRCPSPSLDLRWSVSGVYVLRLRPNVLLKVPKDRGRGRDPTPWSAADIGKAWSLWWRMVPKLSVKEKRFRCPVEHWLPESEGCSARAGRKPCKFSAFSNDLCVQCGEPRKPVGEEASP